MMRHKSVDKRKHTKKNKSLLSKIMLPMSALALLQIIIFLAILTANGGVSYIRKFSYNTVTEATKNRKSNVENLLNQKTALVYETARAINEETGEILKDENLTAEAVRSNKQLNNRILSGCMQRLLLLIRRDMVNDAFVILDTGKLYDKGGKNLRPGLYLRDTDVDENSVTDNKDIYMEMGNSKIAQEHGISLDSGWSLLLDVTDRDSRSFDFFFEPVRTYQDNLDTPLYSLGYWSSASPISESQQESMKYSLPLAADDGTVYGVVGIGLLKKTIQKSAPVNDESICYILGNDLEGSGAYAPMFYSGSAYLRLVNEKTVLGDSRPTEYNLWDFTASGGVECLGSIQKLKLYRSGSPYLDQQWAVISVADQEMILSSYYGLNRTIIISMLSTVAIGIAIAVAISRRISLPVNRMVKALDANSRENELVEFHSSGITEFDTLASSIVDMQADATEYASRVSRIIAMSGSGIGVFMYDCRAGSVFVGESLARLLNFEDIPDRDITVSEAEFKKQLAAIDKENKVMGLLFFDPEKENETFTGETIEISYDNPQDGSVTWLKFSLTRNKANVIGLVQDITNTVAEKKGIAKAKDDEYMSKLLEANAALQDAYAAAQRANNAKTDFLSRMSHDIRTPMNAIIGMTAIAQMNLDNSAKVANCLNKISGSGQFLLSLINDILDMSKIESGKFVLAKEDVNLIRLMDDLVEMIRPSVEEQEHEMHVHIDKMMHENVIGDSLRIRQVFMNIMSNAVKYTPKGGRIDIQVLEKDAGNRKAGCYEFTFEDNGIGMTPEFLEKIFEPFERVNDERVNSAQGTGLGMAITYNIVKMMNGDIRVESEVGKGSRFIVTIFLQIADNEQAALKELNGRRVLVMGDGREECEPFCAMLAEIGMQGIWMPFCEQSVARALETNTNGDSEGFEAVILTRISPETEIPTAAYEISSHIPVILSCDCEWKDIEPLAESLGARVFLKMPLLQSRLRAAMESALGKDKGMSGYDEKEHDFAGHRVLVVDDNEINLEVASEILKMVGLTVETAENGKEAIDLFSSSTPGYYDMIFMDVQMPVMNGYEATEAIRGLSHKDAKKIPIVAMTANAFAEDVRHAKDAGMNAHIAKPLEMEKLFALLSQYLGE